MGSDRRAYRANPIAGQKPVTRSLQPFFTGGMQHGQRFSLFHSVTGFSAQDNPRIRLHLILLLFSAGSQQNGR